jgi:hypothetical protein
MREVPEIRDVPAGGRLVAGTSGVVGLLDVPVTGRDGPEGEFLDVCREPPVEVKEGEVREGLVGTGTDLLCEGLIGTGTDLLREGADGGERNDPPGVPLVRMNEPIELEDRGPEPLSKGGRMEATAEDGTNDNAEEDAGRDVTCVVEPLDAADGTENTPVPDGPWLIDADPLDV